MDWGRIGSRWIQCIYIYMPMSLHSETERIWVWVESKSTADIASYCFN